MSLRRATTALADLAAQLPLDRSAWWSWDGEPVKSAEELAAAANIPVLEAKARWEHKAWDPKLHPRVGRDPKRNDGWFRTTRTARLLGDLLDEFDGTEGEDRDAELNEQDTWTEEQWEEFGRDHYTEDDEVDQFWVPPWSPHAQGIKARKDKLEREMHAAIDGEYGTGENKLRAEVSWARETSNPPGIQVDILFWDDNELDEDGDPKLAGEATRYFHRDDEGNLFVYHQSFGLGPEYRQKGIGTDFTTKMEDYYRESGVKYIKTSPGAEDGGLVWALQGFDFAQDQDYGDVPTNMADWALWKHPDHPVAAEVQELFKRMTNEHVTPLEIAMLGYTPGAETWPGAEIMRGTNWRAVKWLV